jgi:hypothetical protein
MPFGIIPDLAFGFVGIPRDLSVWQMEVSLTQIFDVLLGAECPGEIDHPQVPIR